MDLNRSLIWFGFDLKNRVNSVLGIKSLSLLYVAMGKKVRGTPRWHNATQGQCRLRCGTTRGVEAKTGGECKRGRPSSDNRVRRG
jgi:hypothetical protein